MTAISVPQSCEGSKNLTPLTRPLPLPVRERVRRRAVATAEMRAKAVAGAVENDLYHVEDYDPREGILKLNKRHNGGETYTVHLPSRSCTCPNAPTVARLNRDLEGVGLPATHHCKHVDIASILVSYPDLLKRAMRPTDGEPEVAKAGSPAGCECDLPIQPDADGNRWWCPVHGKRHGVTPAQRKGDWDQ